MNKRIFLKIIIPSIFIFSIIIIGCKKDSDLNPEELKEDGLGNYVELKSKISSFMSKDGGTFNAMNVIGNRINSKSYNKANKSTEDTIDIEDDEWTCADVRETIDEDGNTVTILDYGEDGCDEFGELTKGKITYIWKDDGNKYYSKVLYDNFYSYGTLMNGYSEYTFTDESTIGDNTTDSIWSGTSVCEENMTIVFDDGEEYEYTADYSDKWDGETYTTLEGTFTFKSESEEFSYKVNAPLVYNFECEDTYVAVSGVEEIYYRDSEGVEEYLIDYGDGTCDNKAMITENGETYEIDFDEYEDYDDDDWDDDDWDDNDTTSVG